jgi:hypothetical protein
MMMNAATTTDKQNSFEQSKIQSLANLNSGKDFSTKGSLDAPVGKYCNHSSNILLINLITYIFNVH